MQAVPQLQVLSQLQTPQTAPQAHTQQNHLVPQRLVSIARRLSAQISSNQFPGDGGQFPVIPNLTQFTLPPPLDKTKFQESYATFCASRSIVYDERVMSVDNQPIDLHALHHYVYSEGGAAVVTQRDLWAVIGARMGFVQFPGTDTEPAESGPGVAQQLRHLYKEYLAQFDQLYIHSALSKTNFPGANSTGTHQVNNPAAGNTEGNKPGRLNMMNAVWVYANTSVADMRSRGVPEGLVKFVEQNRPRLQQTLQQQQSFRGMVQKPNAPGSSGQTSEPEGVMPNVSGFPIISTQQQQAISSAARPQPPPPQQGQPQVGINLAGVGHGQPQPRNPMIHGQPSWPARPSQEQMQYSFQLINKSKQEFLGKTLPNMKQHPVPENQRMDYLKTLEQAYRYVQEIEPKLPMLYYVLRDTEMIRKIVVIIYTIREQRNLLSNTTSPKCILPFHMLSSLMMQVQNANAQLNAIVSPYGQQASALHHPSNGQPPSNVSQQQSHIPHTGNWQSQSHHEFQQRPTTNNIKLAEGGSGGVASSTSLGFTSGIAQQLDSVKQDVSFNSTTMYPKATHAALVAALAGFETNISPLHSPVQWVEANRDAIDVTIQNAMCLNEEDRVHCLSVLRSTKVYRRFSVFAFVHRRICRGEDGYALQEALKSWSTWDDITSLVNYQTVNTFLQNWTEKHLDSESDLQSCTTADMLGNLLSLDIMGICAQLVAILTTTNRVNEILGLLGVQAQSLLNLLQSLLDLPYLYSYIKRQFVSAIRQLSENSGLYPQCLVLTGVQRIGKHPVAAGTFGEVWKGIIRGQDIALKIPRLYSESDVVKILKEFSTEIIIWRQLSHPNVLPFHGVYYLDDHYTRVCLISPWMQKGNIVQFLKNFPNSDRVLLAFDIARGLEYLHTMQPKIVHGDLKGVNILISPLGRACLADFGLASIKDSQVLNMSSGSNSRAAGTLRWQAPELMDSTSVHAESHGGNTLASDIYALVCVYYEVFSGNVPFFETKQDAAVMLAVLKGRKPTRPPGEQVMDRGLTDEMWNLMESGWSEDPIKRPTAKQVVECVSSLLSRSEDRLPLCDWDDSGPSRLSYFLAEHHFSSTFADSIQNTFLQYSYAASSTDSDSSMNSQSLKRRRENVEMSKEAMTRKRMRTGNDDSWQLHGL